MVSVITLQRYIKQCDDIIEKNDVEQAEKLENEIVLVFQKEIEGIRSGLSNYSPCMIGSTPDELKDNLMSFFYQHYVK